MGVNYLAAICLSVSHPRALCAGETVHVQGSFGCDPAAQCTSLCPVSQLSHLQGDGNCIYLPPALLGEVNDMVLLGQNRIDTNR